MENFQYGYEYIIIDNNSNDKTIPIIKKNAEKERINS
jgi:glycosyltransferase involved in cell wall biosynthesis